MTKRKKIETGIYRTRFGTYEAFDRDPSGKRISKSFKRLAAARDWRAQVRESRNRGTYVDYRRGRTPFKEYALDWLETKAHRSPKTYTDYLGNIENHLTIFHDTPIGAIERGDIEKWLSSARTESGEAVVRKAFQTLSAILKRAEMNRDIPRTPIVGFTDDDVPTPDAREISPPTPEDVCRLASTIAPRYRVMVLVSGFLGLREGECAALHVDDLDLDRGEALIARSAAEVTRRIAIRLGLEDPYVDKRTKTKKKRTIPLPRFIVQELEWHIARFVGDDGYVFTSPEGGRLRRNNFYNRFYKPAVRRAGLNPNLTFHDLRRTTASIVRSREYLGEHGKVAQLLLRHDSPEMTEDYTMVFDADIERLKIGLDRVFLRAVQGLEEATPRFHGRNSAGVSGKQRRGAGRRAEERPA